MVGTCGVLPTGPLYAQENPDVIIKEWCASEGPHNAGMRAYGLEEQVGRGECIMNMSNGAQWNDD